MPGTRTRTTSPAAARDFLHHCIDMDDLIFIHEVTHAGIEFHRHARSHVPEYRSRLADADRGDVPVYVAASKKYRCVVETSLIISRGSIGTDQSSAQARNATISARVSRSVLEREACALREDEKNSLIHWNSR